MRHEHIENEGTNLPENYGKPIDLATLAILLAEMEKSLRKLRTLAHINRNLMTLETALRGMQLRYDGLYAQNVQYIDHILDTATTVGDYRWLLSEWRESLRKANPLIPPRDIADQ